MPLDIESCHNKILEMIKDRSGLLAEIDTLKEQLKNCSFPPGHYYSPIVSKAEIDQFAQRVWAGVKVDGVSGINLNSEDQIALVKSFEMFYSEIPFSENHQEGVRYYYENNFYSYTDAIFLYSMIRTYRPKQIIEVGSGFSSAVMLDTNDWFFDKQIKLTFIEPYTDRLRSILNEEDKGKVSIIERGVQDVSLDVFEGLEKGDILFIDSTHVSKTGSDVNYIFFEILPRLSPGVLIHFHDIFYPFEYPRAWVELGFSWNEDYILKAFLMYNNSFKVKLFAHYLHLFFGNIFERMPLCYKNPGGNIWLER